MSIRVMSDVYDSDLKDIYEVSVMLALANHADDAGVCYPSMGRIARLSRMGTRGVQGVVKRLEERGYLTVKLNAGPRGTNVFYLSPTPAHRAPPAPDAPRTPQPPPPHPTTFTPAPRAPETSVTINEPSLLVAVAPKPKKRAVSIPDNWAVSNKNIQDAQSANFSEQEIKHESEQFRDYHLARGTTFKDWDAGWRTWLRNSRKFSAGRAPAQRSNALADEILAAARSR